MAAAAPQLPDLAQGLSDEEEDEGDGAHAAPDAAGAHSHSLQPPPPRAPAAKGVLGQTPASRQLRTLAQLHKHPPPPPAVCRICRMGGSAAEPLFYPCRCSGSIKHVHQSCLLDWLRHSGRLTAGAACEVIRLCSTTRRSPRRLLAA